MKVLIPVQDYPYADAQIDFISKHVWEANTTMKLLTIVEPSMITDHLMSVTGHTEFKEVLEDRIVHAEVMLHRLHDKLARSCNSAVKIESSVVVGNPKDIIIATAESWDADLMIMGSHGREGVSRFLLGSVSLSVLAEAPCSVAIIRLSAQKVKAKEAVTAKRAEPLRTPAFNGY